MRGNVWRAGDATSRLLLDIAAGRPASVARPLNGYQTKLAVHHGLIGVMADSPDPHLRQAALPIFSRLQARQQVMEHNLRRLLQSLAAADVKATVVKGPHLARSVYANPAHRTYTDVDILVPPAHLDAALDVLRDDPAVPSVPPKTPKADKRHIPMVDDSGVMFTVDLHWDLFSYSQLRGCANGAVEEAWQQATFRPDHPLGPLWELPYEPYLAFLTTHATLDHRFRLILFRDLAEAARQGVDWERFVTFARRWKLRSFAYLSLLIAAKAVDAPITEEVLDSLHPGYLQMGWLTRALGRTDLVRFDGHRIRPLNLAVVVSHDDALTRARLVMEAPVSFPRWQRRVERASSWTVNRTLLMLASSNQRRGAEVNGERLADGLATKGWDVDFVALFEGGDRPKVRAEPLGDSDSDRRLDFNVVAKLRRHIVDTRPGIVFANGGATLRYAVAATATLRRRPKLVYGSIGQPSYWLRSERHVALQRFLHRRADFILAVGELTRRELVDLMRYDPERIDVVYVGVPDTFFVEHARRDGDLRLLYLGALSAEKDPLTALQVAALLPDARLRFVGSGPLQAPVAAAVAENELDGRVEMVGSVQDVLPHLTWADVLVLTSRTEGFPGAVLEAAAAGVPAVGFDVGGVAEAIVDGETGIVVPAGDIDGMVAALRSLAAQRDRLYDLADRGRLRVRERFSMKQVTDLHDEAFRKVLGEARP